MLKDKTAFCKELISYLEKEDLSASVLFVTRSKSDNSYVVYKGNLLDEVGNNLRLICLKMSKRSYRKPDEKQFKPYDPAQKASECTEFLDGPSLKQIEPLLNLTNGEIVDLKKIDEGFLTGLWYYVIKFDDGKKQLSFYKKYSRSMVLARGLGLALLFKGGDFDKLRHDVFVMQDKADCIYFNDKLIIRSKGNFEQIFDFFQKIKENAESAIKFIRERLPFKIEGFDALEVDFLKHEIKMRKLNNIYSTKTLEKINPKNIKLIIKKGLLKNTTVREENGKMIITSTDPWEVLKILDDDFVKSLLTGIGYDAPHKTRIG